VLGRRGLLHLAAAALPMTLAGYVLPVRQAAVPRSETKQVTVLGGLPNARFWADTQGTDIAEEALRALAREGSTSASRLRKAGCRR
jgi:hypothetical protein